MTLEGRPIDPGAWTRRKARALVALLALTPGHRMHREQVMDRLWPQLGPEAAANNLRKVLHVARRILGDDPRAGAALISSEGDALALPADVWVDVDAFESAAAAGRRTSDPAMYEEAVGLYEGDLLPEDRYEEWASPRQEELRSEFLAVLSEQAELLGSRGELDAAAASLRKAILNEPLDEGLYARLMRINALAGRRHDALETYDRLRATLEAELGVEPSPETQRLRAEIAAGGGLAPELTAELWERVGDLRMIPGDVEGAAAAFESAIGVIVPGPSAGARLHRKAAQAFLAAHDLARAEPHLAAAQSSVADDPADPGRLAAVAANAAWERGDIEDAAELASRALDLAEKHGDPADVATAHETIAIVCHFQGAWREGLHEEIEHLGRAPDDDSQLAHVFDIHHCIGQYHLYGDDTWEDVESYARDTLERAERLGAVRAQAFAWCLLGESLLLQARFDEAAGCLEKSGELHASLGSRSGALPWQRLAELLVCRGEHEAAAAPLRRASAIATVSPMARHLWGRIHATSAFAAVERGDPGEAVRSVRAAAAAGARYGDCPTCGALIHPIAAEAHAGLGDPEGARPHVEATKRVAGFFESSAWRAMAVSAEASLLVAEGDRAGSNERFLAAADLYDRAGQPYWAARARYRAGV